MVLREGMVLKSKGGIFGEDNLFKITEVKEEDIRIKQMETSEFLINPNQVRDFFYEWRK
tara:strand:+ start:89 stop:265 length:177 start_codon:yes stop_codon:yes gene_type:complete